MKKLSQVFIALLFLVGCAKDNAPLVDVFSVNTTVNYEYNTAILHSDVKYDGTIKELVLHYSKEQDLSDETAVLMKKNDDTGLYEARLAGLKDGRSYFYQIEVKDGIGSFSTDIKKFVMDNGDIGAPHALPYTQSFSNGMGSYYSVNLKGGQTWSLGQGCVTMYGKNGQIPEENVDVLISSPVKLNSSADALISMTYKASGFSSIDQEVKIMVTEGFTFGSSYWNYTWKTIPFKLELATQWKTVEIPLTQYVGKTVVVAVYYESSKTSAGKLEIKDMNMMAGTVVNGDLGELHYIPYFQSFAENAGSFIFYNVTGSQTWQASDHKIRMSGKSGNSNKENEDWVLSSPISVKDVSRIVVKIYHTAHDFGNINQELKLYVSDSYHFGSSPANCTWKNGSVQWHDQSSEYDVSSAYFDVSSYQTVTLGLRYSSSTSAAGTISIKYLYINSY